MTFHLKYCRISNSQEVRERQVLTLYVLQLCAYTTYLVYIANGMYTRVFSYSFVVSSSGQTSQAVQRSGKGECLLEYVPEREPLRLLL